MTALDSAGGHVFFQGQSGQRLQLRGSEDLKTWLTLASTTVSSRARGPDGFIIGNRCLAQVESPDIYIYADI